MSVICDACGKAAPTVQTWRGDWEIPEGWTEHTNHDQPGGWKSDEGFIVFGIYCSEQCKTSRPQPVVAGQGTRPDDAKTLSSACDYDRGYRAGLEKAMRLAQSESALEGSMPWKDRVLATLQPERSARAAVLATKSEIMVALLRELDRHHEAKLK